jgi:hypothetical protein
MNKNHTRTRDLFLRGLSIVLVLTSTSFTIVAGSYTNTIPNGSTAALAWSFQNKTVANAFPSPGNGVEIDVYNPSTGTYSSASYDFGSWSNGSLVLSNATGFYFKNNTGNSLTLIVSGTDLTASSTTFSYSGGTWYFLGYAYPQSTTKVNAIECVYDSFNMVYRYTNDNLGYASTVGDQVLNSWDPVNSSWGGGYRTNSSCSSPFTPFWAKLNSSPCDEVATGMSPQVLLGNGFWFKPASSTSWTHYKTTPSCP